MGELKVHFTDFWNGATPEELAKDYLFGMLSELVEVTLDKENPDLLIYSCFGRDHLKYNCFKVFYTGENVKPDYGFCDFSFSFEPNDERNFYLPNVVRYPYFQSIIIQNLPKSIQDIRERRGGKFCNFIYRNYHALERIRFFKKLNTYKKVESPGLVLNNSNESINGHMEKIRFISQFKFTIAFENESAVNYTTEKIYFPLLAGSVPIYWGNPKVTELYHPDAFINANDFDSLDELVEYVKEVDQDDELYKRYRGAPIFAKCSPLILLTKENILNKWKLILATIDKKKSNVSSQSYFKLAARRQTKFYLLMRFSDKMYHIARTIRRFLIRTFLT